ncbi:MAG: DNA-directed RNA polymerase subunit omega [Deltaproteobacteria bacterium]
MARITIEDSLIEAKNKFALVLLASNRAKQLIKKEARPLVESKNREVVVALREIAAQKIGYKSPELLDSLKESYNVLAEEVEFVDDEDDVE